MEGSLPFDLDVDCILRVPAVAIWNDPTDGSQRFTLPNSCILWLGANTSTRTWVVMLQLTLKRQLSGRLEFSNFFMFTSPYFVDWACEHVIREFQPIFPFQERTLSMLENSLDNVPCLALRCFQKTSLEDDRYDRLVTDLYLFLDHTEHLEPLQEQIPAPKQGWYRLPVFQESPCVVLMQQYPQTSEPWEATSLRRLMDLKSLSEVPELDIYLANERSVRRVVNRFRHELPKTLTNPNITLQDAFGGKGGVVNDWEQYGREPLAAIDQVGNHAPLQQDLPPQQDIPLQQNPPPSNASGLRSQTEQPTCNAISIQIRLELGNGTGPSFILNSRG